MTLPTEDSEGDEVALRLAEAGVLADLMEAWRSSPREDEPKVEAAIAALVSEVLDRPWRSAPVRIDGRIPAFSALPAWFRAAWFRR